MLSSANALNLDQSKILLFGKPYNQSAYIATLYSQTILYRVTIPQSFHFPSSLSFASDTSRTRTRPAMPSPTTATPYLVMLSNLETVIMELADRSNGILDLDCKKTQSKRVLNFSQYEKILDLSIKRAFEDQMKIQTQFNLFPNNFKPLFSLVCCTSLLKTLWEKEKLLIWSNFSFSHSIFYPSGELFTIFIEFEIVVCKLSFWKSPK